MSLPGCCTYTNWFLFCKWGGSVACLFFIIINLVVLSQYAGEMDRVTVLLRCFTLLFCAVIAVMSIDSVRTWCKPWLVCAWFLSNWATRGFLMVYLGVVAASSYAIDRFEEDCIVAFPGSPMAKDEEIGQWVDVSRYLSGALLVFFGALYLVFSFCGGGADEDPIPEMKWNQANDPKREGTPATPEPISHPIDLETGAGKSESGSMPYGLSDGRML